MSPIEDARVTATSITKTEPNLSARTERLLESLCISVANYCRPRARSRKSSARQIFTVLVIGAEWSTVQ